VVTILFLLADWAELFVLLPAESLVVIRVAILTSGAIFTGLLIALRMEGIRCGCTSEASFF